MRSLRSVLRDEKGAAIIMVAFALVMIFGFAALAIDLSLVQLAKTQLQNAADAAALAGAMVLCDEGPDSARAEAIRIAGLNVAIQDIQRPVIIPPDSVSVSGDYVRVVTLRTEATGDPITLYFMRVLDPLLENKGEMTARATARGCIPICGTDCLKPWCIPDRWNDTNGNKTWDPGELYDPYTTGYSIPRDIGVQVTLKPASAEWQTNWYYPVRFPGYSGGDDYRDWIADCVDPSLIIHLGDQLDIEPGNMVGPTKQGLADLMKKEPRTLRWDLALNTVVDNSTGQPVIDSPLIVKAAAFNPTTAGPKPHFVTVSKILVLFIEGYNNKGDIVGRFMRMATEGEPCPPGTPPGFLYTVRLVE